MRQAFAHEAVLGMEAGSDTGAPGASVTKELCGSWEHEPPCPLAPHHSAATWVGGQVRLRVLFAVAPELEQSVRSRIDAALANGHVVSPGGDVLWTLASSGPSAIVTGEHALAERLRRE